LATQPDVELAPDCHDLCELPLVNATRHADMVIVGAQEPENFALARALLRAWPRVKVLVVANEGCNAVMYRLRPHQVSLGELSPQELLAAIRAEAQSLSTCHLPH
jgi:hypothetical protein